MGANSAIEWTDHTFNPWWGCVKVSPVCTHCYAATFAGRFNVEWGPKAERRFFGDKKWADPLKWNAQAEREGVRRRVFCASMADMFEILPDEHPQKGQLGNERIRLLNLIEATPALDWLLLTKRPENVTGFLDRWSGGYPDNVWVGTTVENQEYADRRIPELLQIPARVRFLSCEPLLGPVDLTRVAFRDNGMSPADGSYRCYWTDALAGAQFTGDQNGDVDVEINRVDWVIAGGESGPGARPSDPEWFRSLRDQCQAAGVAFHFKQWGDWLPFEPDGRPPFWVDQTGKTWDGHALNMLDPESGELFRDWHPDSEMGPCAWRRVGKKRAGRLLDGRTWDEFPEVAHG